MHPTDYVIIFNEINCAADEDDAHYLGDRIMYRALINIGEREMADAWWETTGWKNIDEFATNRNHAEE